MKNKITYLTINAIPIVLMIGLIPFIADDYLLMGVYIAIIIVSFLIKRERNDFLFFGFGFVVMIISEYIFISTGVEKFERNSFLGIMPIWLPFLWAYAFVAIKRGIIILDHRI